jgi:molybdopterin-guanine dinucleotide biosynthesis protein A
MRNITKQDISALILAGGQGSRMNFKDKGLILFEKKPFIWHVRNAIQAQVSRIFIGANQNFSQYQVFGEVIKDELEGFQGPLAGVQAALNVCQSRYLLVVPCDGVFVNAQLIDRLTEVLAQSQSALCVASSNGKIQPTFCLLEKNLQHNLNLFLASGGRKFGLWLKNNQVIEVDCSDISEVFVNLNTPQDLTNSAID